MKSQTHTNWQALIKLVGKQSESEKNVLNEYAHLSEEDVEIYHTLNRIKLDCDYSHALEMKDEVQEVVYHKIFEKSDFYKAEKYRNLYLFLLSVAACIGILFSLSLFYFQRTDNRNENSWVVFTSPNGVSNIVLPDSSIVTLNAGSTVSYSTSYNTILRQVKLEGEACFRVTSNKKKPFVVSTKEIDIKVLGTVFNVTAYKEDKEVVASLVSGSIELTNKTNECTYLLVPNQSAIYSKRTSSIELQPFEAEYVTSWMNGKILFRKKSFADICKMLERKFNCIIQIQNAELYQKVLTGKFINNERLPQILDVIRINAPFKYTISNNLVIIY